MSQKRQGSRREQAASPASRSSLVRTSAARREQEFSSVAERPAIRSSTCPTEQRYGDRLRSKPLVHVQAGASVGIIGPNGAGKTTCPLMTGRKNGRGRDSDRLDLRLRSSTESESLPNDKTVWERLRRAGHLTVGRFEMPSSAISALQLQGATSRR